MPNITKFCYAAALSLCLLAGCSTLSRNWSESDVGPEIATLSSGAAAVATNPANPFGWIEVLTGAAGIAAVIYGGPKALAKVRGFLGKK